MVFPLSVYNIKNILSRQLFNPVHPIHEVFEDNFFSDTFGYVRKFLYLCIEFRGITSKDQ